MFSIDVMTNFMFSGLVLLLLDTTHQLQVSPNFYYFRRYMFVEGLGPVKVVAIKDLTRGCIVLSMYKYT
jgi:hypothetical protein